MRVDDPDHGLVLSSNRLGKRRFHQHPTTPERWLSGRKRRFAKPLGWETGLGGSNPPLSAPFASDPVQGRRPQDFAARRLFHWFGSSRRRSRQVPTATVLARPLRWANSGQD